MEPRGSFGAVARVQLAQHMLRVRLNRGLGELKRRGNLAVVRAGGNHGQHLSFTVREQVHLDRGQRISTHPWSEVAQHLGRHLCDIGSEPVS